MGWKSPGVEGHTDTGFLPLVSSLLCSLPTGTSYACSACLSPAAHPVRPLPLLFSLLALSPCDPPLQLLRGSPEMLPPLGNLS